MPCLAFNSRAAKADSEDEEEAGSSGKGKAKAKAAPKRPKPMKITEVRTAGWEQFQSRLGTVCGWA